MRCGNPWGKGWEETPHIPVRGVAHNTTQSAQSISQIFTHTAIIQIQIEFNNVFNLERLSNRTATLSVLLTLTLTLTHRRNNRKDRGRWSPNF